MAYYYLMASLPMLKSDGDMPISYAQFLEMCKDHVSGAKYEILKNLSIEASDGPLVSDWAKFYEVFKAEMTYQRNQRLGKKTEKPEESDAETAKRIAEAIKNENPLHAEEMLLFAEFEKLDALIGTHYFDDVALMGYALKLKLLERKNMFSKESGKAELYRMVQKIEEQILQMEQE